MALTPKQRAFVAAYAGNATEAARAAGYGAPGQAGHDLLKNPEIARLIRDREAKEVRPLISSRADRQKFWSEVMNDTRADMGQRLKASELLGKSEADFTDNLKHSGGVRLSFSIGLAPKKDAAT